jgi:hypothetical protein
MESKNTLTPFEKFKEFTKQVISVPKAEIDRREAEYQKARKNKRKRRKL